MTLLRPRTWTLLAALLGGFATSLVTTLAQLHFAYRALGLHVALETAAAFAPCRRLANPPRTARIGMVACFALLSAVAAGMALAADHLPAGLDPNAMPGRTELLSAPMGI